MTSMNGKENGMNEIYRQGDVLLRRIDDVPLEETNERAVARDGDRIVLAYGEVTGHAHAIASTEAVLTHDPETEARFLRVLAEGGVDLIHEEHATITLPRGTYEVVQQREYTAWGERAVQD